MPDPEGPDDRARPHWSVPPPPPNGGDAEDTRPAPLGEEFLYHLYRGSELLKEDNVYEAKSELERAISLQPKDVEGQSLLGVVYFRLGHYPRAIQIYEELVRVRPEEIAPRINLALCYLKTSQLPGARALLEEIVQHRPDHLRAWGYLGLAFQRLGDLEKASVAFDRAGRPQLAARLRAMRAADSEPAPERVSEPPPAANVQEILQSHVQAAISVPPPPLVPDRPETVPPASRKPSGSFPAPGTRVSIPATIARVASDATLVFPEHPRVAAHADGIALVRIDRAFHVRAEAVRAVLPDGTDVFRRAVLRRRGRGLTADEPIGGPGNPFVTLEGAGRLVVAPPETHRPFVTGLAGEPLYVREERLLGFDGSIDHESGRLTFADGHTNPLLHLTGAGFVVLSLEGPLHGIEVAPERPLQIRTERLVGWVGRLLARPLAPEESPAGPREWTALAGTGVALVDGG